MKKLITELHEDFLEINFQMLIIFWLAIPFALAPILVPMILILSILTEVPKVGYILFGLCAYFLICIAATWVAISLIKQRFPWLHKLIIKKESCSKERFKNIEEKIDQLIAEK